MAVEIELQQGDLTAVEADVVLLKHAQSFYGADALFASILEKHGLCTEAEIRVAPWKTRILATRGSTLAPSRVLYVGTPPLGKFRYREMEQFATTAIEFLRDSGLPVRSLSTTVHGAGYGLDVEEALQAMIRGFERGVSQSPVEGLERIIFVEQNPRRAAALAKSLASLPSSQIGSTSKRRDMPVSLQSPQKKRVFVAMPFSEEFEDVYQFGIYDVIRRSGFVCERVDEKAIAGSIVDYIREGIEAAEFVVADLSGERPNVYLEVGYAWGLKRKVLLLARDGTRLHFDLSHHKCIFYKTIGKLAEELERSIKKLTTEGADR
jgi:hypothetical protein